MTLRRTLAMLAATTAVAMSCSSGDTPGYGRDDSGASVPADSRPQSAARVNLTGAGASFPYPLYARWFNEFGPSAGVFINYHSVGSAAGIAAVLDHTVDFGATDVPMSNEELAQAGTRILHVPTAVGAVGVTYQLPSLRRPLRLSGDVVAALFLGTITRWNDPRLQVLNQEVVLPDLPVRVVHRSDGSGTTYIFTEYLTAVSQTWAKGPGRGRRVEWPLGVAGSGNEGVASEVKATEGAVGYVEVVYARQNRLPIAHIRNAAGRFVSPLPFEIATAAASSFEAHRSDASSGDAFRTSLVNAPGEQAYPIASFTWLLIAPEVIGRDKTQTLASLLTWAFNDGADVTTTLGYVPLPASLAAEVVRTVERAAPPR